jgi:DNA-binding NarL/FixJ family response regulator
MNPPRTRVVIADDAMLIREGIRQLLVAGGCQVLAMASDTDQLWSALREHDNAVEAVVLDIRMPPTHTDEGLRALEALRAQGSSLGVLLLSMYASPALAVRALSAGGATGYLLKDRVNHGRALVDAVRVVADGGTVVDPEVVDMFIRASRAPQRLDTLTTREQEVLQLMAEGRSNAGIAGTLQLSVKTVETHVEHILEKLGIEPSPGEHRRVLAVLEMLRSQSA